MYRHAATVLLLVTLLITLLGCEQYPRRGARPQIKTAPSLPPAYPVLARLRHDVAMELKQRLGPQQQAVLKSLAEELTAPIGCKSPLTAQTLANPWTGLVQLELLGYEASLVAQAGPAALPELLSVLEGGMKRTAAVLPPRVMPAARKPEDLVAELSKLLAEAYRLRAVALRGLTPAEQQFLFNHAAAFVADFVPHVGELTDKAKVEAEADRRFCQLFEGRLDYGALLASAQTLAYLSDQSWTKTITEAFSGAVPRRVATPGVTGDVLFARETEFGWIIVGGPGPNTYTLSEPAAIILDIGGDDLYVGTVAASSDLQDGLSLVVDLSGNDAYHAGPFGLATGRLGVGLLIDRSGNDSYHLSNGTGGAGFAGIGILYDESGDDRYLGARFSQGVAVAGLGLLLDRAGNDQHTSAAYALGFGGPAGVGAVVDITGDDVYQCGDKLVSDYTSTEAPEGKPGDRLYQYDCFGMGTGSGKRVFLKEEKLVYGLGGGLGMVLDLDGNDRYRSANFSQGAGYFYGIGLKLDLAGNDEHAAARYGHAAGAHAAVGLFIDAQGEDRYHSTGPTYNGATAWDRSVMLAIDAGPGNDRYDFRSSSGLGRADHHAWSAFIEEGGQDRYDLPSGLGLAVTESVSAFFDLGGEDDYSRAPEDGAGARKNRQVSVDPTGGLFVDR